MANWCQNWVTFQGEETQINEIKKMFSEMKTEQHKTGHGQLPDFMTEPKEDYFFDISIEETAESIYYATKWSPNVLDLIEIANHFKVGFEVEYEERACMIFGKAVFKHGDSEAEFYDLDNDDFDLFDYDEETDTYSYQNETYDSEYDILETIFEKKFNQNY